jgi:hypothetical protein
MIDDDPVLNFTASKLARIIHKKKDWESGYAFADFRDEGWSPNSDGILGFFRAIQAFSNGMAHSCDSILSDTKLLATLKAENFDIAIAEYITLCPYAIYRKIGLKKYITVSAMPLGASFSSLFGISSISEISYLPEYFNCPSGKMTFIDRLKNVMAFTFGNLFFGALFITPATKVINRHYPEMHIQVIFL